MTVLVQCIVCDETWEVRLRVHVGTGHADDRWETISEVVAAEGGCPECGCTEVTPI